MFVYIPIDGLFYTGLALIALISYPIAHLVMRIGKTVNGAFYALVAVSLGLFFWLVIWFDEAARQRDMGTIPVVFNFAFAVLLYATFVALSYFVLRAVYRRTQVNR